MSVHGEFERYLDSVLTELRTSERSVDAGLAEVLTREAADPAVALEARARRVLDGPLGTDPSQWQGFPRLEAARDPLLAICRIILGR
jgi:hypothetical protein